MTSGGKNKKNNSMFVKLLNTKRNPVKLISHVVEFSIWLVKIAIPTLHPNLGNWRPGNWRPSPTHPSTPQLTKLKPMGAEFSCKFLLEIVQKRNCFRASRKDRQKIVSKAPKMPIFGLNLPFSSMVSENLPPLPLPPSHSGWHWFHRMAGPNRKHWMLVRCFGWPSVGRKHLASGEI